MVVMVAVCVCAHLFVFIKFHIIAQHGPSILIFHCYTMVCVFMELRTTAQPGLDVLLIQYYSYKSILWRICTKMSYEMHQTGHALSCDLQRSILFPSSTLSVHVWFLPSHPLTRSSFFPAPGCCTLYCYMLLARGSRLVVPSAGCR